MERIAPAEWRLIVVALENYQLVVGDNAQLHRDHDRHAEAAEADREYETLNRVIGKAMARRRAQRDGRRR